jgi:predicted  nucleic acid-binding Zn-ribbon protein
MAMRKVVTCEVCGKRFFQHREGQRACCGACGRTLWRRSRRRKAAGCDWREYYDPAKSNAAWLKWYHSPVQKEIREKTKEMGRAWAQSPEGQAWIAERRRIAKGLCTEG